MTFKTAMISSILIGLFFLSMITPAVADCVVAKNTMDLSTMSLEDLMNIEVTSASKKPEKVADAPASVYVITHEDIKRYGYRTITQALQRIAGFYASSDRNYDYVGVRGYARPGDYNTRVLLLIDGLRVNDPLYNTSPTGDDLSLDIRSIERIEIVKGPGSALWGTNAMLAVVNIITRKASDINGGSFAQEYGSDSTKTSFFEYGTPNTGDFQFAGSLTTTDSAGEEYIDFHDINETATNVDGSTANHCYFTASYKEFNFFMTSGKFNKNVPTGSYDVVFNDSRNKTEDKKTIAALSFEHMVSPKHNGNFFARFFSNSYDYSGDYVYNTQDIQMDINDPNRTIMNDNGSAKWWGGEIRYSADLTSKLSYVSGLEYTKVNKLHIGNYVEDPFDLTNLDANSTNTTFSYYLQSSYDISDSLRLITGARMDDYSTYGTKWSPRGAFIKKLDDTSTLKLLWGKAFRAPDGYEYNYTQAITGMPDPGLSSEEITTSELVWDKVLGSRARLVNSVYRFDLKNIITQVEDVQFENSGTVRSVGIESQLDYILKDGSTAYFNVSFLNTEDTHNDQQVTNSPKFIMGAGISLPIFSERLYFTPSIQLIGSRKTLNGNTIGSSAVTNVTVTKGNIHSKWDLSLSVYNLFDKYVETPGAYEHPEDRIPQVGRQFLIETAYHF